MTSSYKPMSSRWLGRGTSSWRLGQRWRRVIAISENGEGRTARAPDRSRTSVQSDGMAYWWCGSSWTETKELSNFCECDNDQDELESLLIESQTEIESIFVWRHSTTLSALRSHHRRADHH